MFKITNDIDLSALDAIIQQDTQAWFDELLEDFRVAGKHAVARMMDRGKVVPSPWVGNFTNRTWNLVSSMGYCIMYENRIIESYFPESKGDEGAGIGKEMAERLAVYGDEGDGIVLVVVAGEEYAAFVEAKGYDVISTSSDTFENELRQLLR